MKGNSTDLSLTYAENFLRIFQYVRHWMRKSEVESVSRFVVGFIATAIYLMPIFWMVSTSLKPPTEIFQTPPVLIPAQPQIDSYRSALGLPTDRPELYITGTLYFKNSFIIAASTMLLTLAFAIPAAYALSRFNFRGKTTFMLFLIVTQMLPAVLLVIPLFVLFKMFSLYNTYLSVILADTALALPFAIIILRTSEFYTNPRSSGRSRLDRRRFALAGSMVYRATFNEGKPGCGRSFLISNGLGRICFCLIVFGKT
jgi:ABC-type glycerol-3-phosphate transport system permease component